MNYFQNGLILFGMARQPRIHTPGGLYHVILKSTIREPVFARGIIGYLASELGTASHKEVAQVFNRDPSPLSKLVVNIKEGLKETEEHQNRVNRITSNVTEWKIIHLFMPDPGDF